MKNHIFSCIKICTLFIIFIVLFSSCIPQKKLIYIQAQAKNDTIKTKKYINNRKSDYKIQSGDNLFIRISSLDVKTYSFFNKTGGNTYSNYMNSDISVYLNSYTVNDTGYVNFPVIGDIFVKDLTVQQVKNLIQKSLNKYLKKPTVIVKIVNYNITVLGEVNRPGKYKVYQDQINIFDALGLAGDITDYGNRNKVIIVRQNDKGSIVHKVDLTKDNILKSRYYYLMPNDIVYVEPLKAKSFGARSFSWQLLLSTITTFLVVLRYFKTF